MKKKTRIFKAIKTISHSVKLDESEYKYVITF